MSIHNVSKRFGLSVLWAVGVLALTVSLFSGTAWAQNYWNQRTSVTFSQPVEVPGAGAQVLPAGTYVFRLLDSTTNRHIVQIFNEDETRLYSTVLAIPNHRRVATNRTVITFAERPAGQPQAIQVWFYPGNTFGHEFVYSRARAVQLAEAADEPVLFVSDEALSAVAQVGPAPTPTAPPLVALVEAPVAAVGAAGEEIELAAVVEAPVTQVAALPRTATRIPLLALAGALSLGAGLLLGWFRRTSWLAG